jgi:hypothetical protein
MSILDRINLIALASSQKKNKRKKERNTPAVLFFSLQFFFSYIIEIEQMFVLAF